MRPHRRQPTRLPCPWDSPGKNTGVGCHFLLQCVKVESLSRVQLLGTPWTVAYQAPPSMGLSRQEYCSGLPFPFPGDLPDPGIEPGSPTVQADALRSEPPGKPWCFKLCFKFHVLNLVFINTRELSWEMMFQRNCIRYFHESSVCCSVLFNPLLRISEW